MCETLYHLAVFAVLGALFGAIMVAIVAEILRPRNEGRR